MGTSEEIEDQIRKEQQKYHFDNVPIKPTSAFINDILFLHIAPRFKCWL